MRCRPTHLVAQAEVRLGPLDPAFHIGDGIPALGGVRNRHAGDGHGKLVRLGIADEGLSKLEALLHFNAERAAMRAMQVSLQPIQTNKAPDPCFGLSHSTWRTPNLGADWGQPTRA